MLGKQKKLVEQPAEEQKRTFGKDTMHPVGEIEPIRRDILWKKGVDITEVWESKSKCRCEGIGVTSAVRVDIFHHAGKVEGFSVFEVKDGKLLESRFNSKLEPIAGGTAPASLTEEHRGKLEGFMKGEFFKHAMGRTPGVQTIVNVQGAERHIYLNKNIASALKLKEGMQCKWERGTDFLIMTPLKEATILVKVQKMDTSLVVGIPKDMLAVGGLKRGDSVVWVEKEGQLSPRKCEEGAPNAVKIRKYGNIMVVPIPTEMAEKQKVEKGGYGIWTFDENRALWLEVEAENSRDIRIARVWKHVATFGVHIPTDMGEWPKVGEAVILEVKDGKLYLTKKMEARI
jgi:hypothetical protein